MRKSGILVKSGLPPAAAILVLVTARLFIEEMSFRLSARTDVAAAALYFLSFEDGAARKGILALRCNYETLAKLVLAYVASFSASFLFYSSSLFLIIF